MFPQKNDIYWFYIDLKSNIEKAISNSWNTIKKFNQFLFINIFVGLSLLLHILVHSVFNHSYPFACVLAFCSVATTRSLIVYSKRYVSILLKKINRDKLVTMWSKNFKVVL